MSTSAEVPVKHHQRIFSECILAPSSPFESLIIHPNYLGGILCSSPTHAACLFAVSICCS